MGRCAVAGLLGLGQRACGRLPHPLGLFTRPGGHAHGVARTELRHRPLRHQLRDVLGLDLFDEIHGFNLAFELMRRRLAQAAGVTGPEIRAPLLGDFLGFRPPPAGDCRVIAGKQNFRHRPAAPFGRAGVMRVFQQAALEAFLRQRIGEDQFFTRSRPELVFRRGDLVKTAIGRSAIHRGSNTVCMKSLPLRTISAPSPAKS